MRRNVPGEDTRRWLLLGTGAALALSILMMTVALGLLRSDKDANQKRAPVLVSAAALILAMGASFAGIVRLKKEISGPPGPTEEVLAQWRQRLRREVANRRAGSRRSDGRQGSDLFQMLRGSTVMPLRGEERIDRAENDLAKPRLRVEGRILQWSEITARWDGARGRMVILGPGGYGKTVAALTLLKHINSIEGVDPLLAELFPLGEWYRWQADHPGEPLSNWLADQLAQTYPETRGALAEALVGADFVPVLDGLDEVPASHRQACKEAIDAYAEPSQPFRPFIVTCRPEEYAELAPDWVSLDREVMLIGLEPDQVWDVLEERTGGKPGWDEIRKRVARGEKRLLDLFRSPLRLGIALQTYRDRDAGELGQLEPGAAETHLWDQLLMLGAPTFHDDGPERIRSWLHFLAAGMERENRQRFWLHELYLFVPERPKVLRRFRILSALIAGVALGLTYGLSRKLGITPNTELVDGLIDGVSYGVLYGLVFGLGVGMVFRPGVGSGIRLNDGLVPGIVAGLIWLGNVMSYDLGYEGRVGAASAVAIGVAIGVAILAGLVMGLGASETPSMTSLVGWRPRLNHAREHLRRTPGFALGLALLIGLTGPIVNLVDPGSHDALPFALRYGVAAGLIGGLLGALMAVVNAGRVPVMADPPAGLGGRGLSAVLDASRNVGLTAGLVGGLAVGLLAGVGLELDVRGNGFTYALAVGPSTGLIAALVAGFTVGMTSGLDAWLYHQWLRRHLARRHFLPRRLPQFLEWCALPERGWLRISDACEFRHRELLDLLARPPGPSGDDASTVVRSAANPEAGSPEPEPVV